jgi:hypothetical protein
MRNSRIRIGNAKRGSRNQTPAPPPGPSAPVLTANNATMSLDWTYNGPTCDDFHIFEHLPNQAPGVFNDRTQVTGDVHSWATGFDDPADAAGHKYYIVPEIGDPETGDDDPVTPPSNTVNFAAG